MKMKEKASTHVLLSKLFLLLLGVLLFVPSSILAAQAPNPRTPDTDTNEYVIGAGDVLEISIWKEPNLQKTVPVRIDGRISLPLVGDVMAAGMTIKELTTFLTDKFSKFITNPNVGIILTQSNSKRYFVVGQVTKPGEFPMDSPITVLQAIARAGGFTEWAKTSKVKIVRGRGAKEEILKFDYSDVIEGKNMHQNITLEAGDTIVVP